MTTPTPDEIRAAAGIEQPEEFTVGRAIELLRQEFDGFDQGVSKVTTPNEKGPDTVVGVRMSNGAWYMLRARIKHLLDAAEQSSPQKSGAGDGAE